jgi:hypothetical protein
MLIRVLAVLAVALGLATFASAQNGNGGAYSTTVTSYKHFTTDWNAVAPSGNGITVYGNPYSIKFKFAGTSTFTNQYTTYRVWYQVWFESEAWGTGTASVNTGNGEWETPEMDYDRGNRPYQVTFWLQAWTGTHWTNAGGPNSYEIYFP